MTLPSIEHAILGSQYLCAYDYEPKTVLAEGFYRYRFGALDFADYYSGLEASIYIGAGKLAFIVFRGSEMALNDWINNLQVMKTSIGTTKVHTGWAFAVLGTFPSLMKAVTELALLGYSLILTGHSRGGALAKIASVLIPFPTTCITFGAPPVAAQGELGGQDPAQYGLNKKQNEFFHFVNEGDWIPSLLLPFGYGMDSYIRLPAPEEKGLLAAHRLGAYYRSLRTFFSL